MARRCRQERASLDKDESDEEREQFERLKAKFEPEKA